MDDDINYLPDSIEELYIKSMFNMELITKLPENLKKCIKPYNICNFKIIEDKFPDIEFLTR